MAVLTAPLCPAPPPPALLLLLGVAAERSTWDLLREADIALGLLARGAFLIKGLLDCDMKFL